MEVGDTIVIPGYGEFRLTCHKNNEGCEGCVAEKDDSLCYALPYCCTIDLDTIWVKVEKLS